VKVWGIPTLSGWGYINQSLSRAGLPVEVIVIFVWF
jgi:hypothetical protein